MRTLHPRHILHLAALTILAFGLGAAACIYLLIDDSDDTPGGQTVIVNGTTYSVPANATKLYARELQMFGGKAALVFDDLNRWFSGLWHGRALASTVLCLTLVASLALLMAARYLYPDQPGRSDR